MPPTNLVCGHNMPSQYQLISLELTPKYFVLNTQCTGSNLVFKFYEHANLTFFQTEKDNFSLSFQYSCLENPMDRGTWWAAVHGVAKSRTRLSDFTFTFHFHASEKEMATHSSVLAWRIPRTGEPGGLPSMGSHRVGHD